MKYLYGLLLFAWLAVQQLLKPDFQIHSIAPFLGALSFFVSKERYFHAIWSTLLFAITVFVLSFYNRDFIMLAGIPLYDLVYDKRYVTSIPVILAAVILMQTSGTWQWVFQITAGVIFGYIAGVKDEKEKNYLTLLDEERRLRYQLEKAKNELVHSEKEIEHLTEIRERNRIAHELHDNIGHSIAGVLFQLRGALSVIGSDKEKARNIIDLCTDKLTETLETSRKTVYNIRSGNPSGLDFLNGIVRDFKYCPVSFEHSGDFGTVSAYNMRMLESSIKEALTNTSRHSDATAAEIKVDIGKRNIRFFYKDNGKGCPNIKANVGLSGMQQRISDAGGTFSVDGSNGFTIVCIIPNRPGEGSGNEDIDSR